MLGFHLCPLRSSSNKETDWQLTVLLHLANTLFIHTNALWLEDPPTHQNAVFILCFLSFFQFLLFNELLGAGLWKFRSTSYCHTLPGPATKAYNEKTEHVGTNHSVIVSTFHHRRAVWQHARELWNQPSTLPTTLTKQWESLSTLTNLCSANELLQRLIHPEMNFGRTSFESESTSREVAARASWGQLPSPFLWLGVSGGPLGRLPDRMK